MILYKQQSHGLPYQRACRVVIENQYNRAPRCEFHEEMISDYGTDYLSKQVGSLRITYDPAKEYPLLNPETGDTIGTFTQGQLYAMLYSVYISEAMARDAEIEAQRAADAAAAEAARAAASEVPPPPEPTEEP